MLSMYVGTQLALLFYDNRNIHHALHTLEYIDSVYVLNMMRTNIFFTFSKIKSNRVPPFTSANSSLFP